MTERDNKYDVTAFLIFLHKYFSLKHVLGDTQHVCMMIISNHAKPPCFLEQLGEVPFVDMEDPMPVFDVVKLLTENPFEEVDILVVTGDV